jgi:hypothetical protein
MIKTAPNEREVWVWLSKVLKELGHDGMSSDESELDDEVEVILKVKKLPWRREISRELDFIDKKRGHGGFSKRGSAPMRRQRGRGEPSTRPPVTGLPAVLYDRRWLQGDCPPEVEMKVSREAFQWMNLVFDTEGVGEADEEEDEEESF